MADARARLTKCFSAVFPTLAPDDIAGASPDTVAAWDSIANVTLLVVVEEEFGVTVAAEDIERLTSFAALLDYVVARLGHTSEPRVG
jgi:acyl carrier protein